MKKNGFVLLILILVIAILGVVGYFGYKNFIQTSNKNTLPGSSPNITITEGLPSLLNKVSAITGEGEAYSQMDWKYKNDLYIGLPGLITQSEEISESDSLSKQEGYFSELQKDGFIQNETNSGSTNLLGDVSYFKSFEKGEIKCKVSWWSTEEIVTADGKPLPNEAGTYTNTHIQTKYQTQLSCGQLNKLILERYDLMIPVIEVWASFQKTGPINFINIKKWSGEFAGGDMGHIPGLSTTFGWLAAKTNEGWKIILGGHSGCKEAYQKYNVPVSFQDGIVYCYDE